MKLLSLVVLRAVACLAVVGSVAIANCQTWTPVTTAPPVSLGAMMLLTDGRVLLHEEPNCSGSSCKGKDYTAWYTLTPDINGNYVTGTWTQVASTPNGYAPLYFASAVLQDGKVAVQGGEYQCAAGSCADAWQSLGALYDPVQNVWTATAPPIPNSLEAMGDSESVVLPNGTWMIGLCCAQFVGYTPYPDYVYFNESSLNFTPMGNSGDGQTTEFDEAGFNLLPSGQVMMVNVPLGAYSATLATSQIYDPPSNTWLAPVSTQVQLWDADCGNATAASYELGPVMLLPNGTLFATGASSCQAANLATYNLSTGVWTAQAPFPGKSAANDAPGATEINGNAIVITSPYTNTFSTPLTIYEWNATTSTLSTFPNVTNASKDDSYVTHLLVLPNGQIMFTDFSTNGVEILTSAGTYQPAWQPTITTSPTNLTIGQTYSISGTQFNGLSTGASYGDDFQDNTNYPLVRIVNSTTNHVFYARTHDHSTMGVATGSTPVSTNFDVPVMETGACELYVVANGIPSAPSACMVGEPSGIYSPVNNTPLTSTTVTFSWGGNGSATAYWIDIGSSQGTNNIYSSGSLSSSTLSLAVSSLPSTGIPLWVRWYYQISGNWQSIDYNYTALGGSNSLGSINTPAPGSTFATNSQAFTWSAGTGATAYWLNAGSTVGGNNYYSSGNLGNVVTATATNLPTNGSAIYITLNSLVGGTWYSNSYTYTALNAGSGGATMSTPAPGSTLTGSTQAFTWVKGTGTAQAYWLYVGSTAGASNYYNSGTISSRTLTSTAKGLPTNGSTVYVTLFTEFASTYYPTPYTYTAFNAASAAGVLTTPPPTSTLTGSTVTFDWTAGSGATAYWLDIGSSAGGNNYYSSGNLGNVLTTTASGLPTNGSTVYATLYSLVSGTWTPNAYTYTALNAASAGGVITTPGSGSTLTGSTVTFDWTAGSGASAYWLDIGNTAGGNSYYSSGNLGNVLTTTASGLPTDGSAVYATLYSLIGGNWVGNAYSYTALNSNSGLATMQTPMPGSVLSGTTSTFTWSSDSSATAYWVDIGSSAGGNDIYSSGNLGTALTTTVSTLPANGNTIYVSLYSYVGGQWLNNPVTYTSGP
jgi:hypothetical protein